MQLNYSLGGKKLGPHCHTLAGSYISKRPAYWKLVWENSVALALCIREMRIKEKKTQIAIGNEQFLYSLGARGGDSACPPKELLLSTSGRGAWSSPRPPPPSQPYPLNQFKEWPYQSIMCLPWSLWRDQRMDHPDPISKPWWSRRLLTKRHLLLWGIINGEGIPMGKHASTLHLFSRVVNCSTGMLCTQSVVHYT